MKSRKQSMEDKINKTISGVKKEILDYNKVDKKSEWYISVKDLFAKVKEKGKGSLPAVNISEIDLEHNIRNVDKTSSNFIALKESIKEQGLLQRPVLTLGLSSSKPFLCVAGHRRILALQELNVQTCPAELIYSNDENDIHLARLAENLVRQNLKPLELAESVARLKERINTTTAGVARILKKDRMYVTQLLKIASWPKEAKKIVHENDLNIKRLYLIARQRLTNEELIQELMRIVDKKVMNGTSQNRKGCFTQRFDDF